MAASWNCCFSLSLQSLVYFTFAALGGDPLAQMSLVGDRLIISFSLLLF